MVIQVNKKNKKLKKTAMPGFLMTGSGEGKNIRESSNVRGIHANFFTGGIKKMRLYGRGEKWY